MYLAAAALAYHHQVGPGAQQIADQVYQIYGGLGAREIANYLPSLAGAIIILLTLGVALINILVNYIQRQVGGASNPFLASVFNILKFGLYAVIITIAVQLFIFYWIHFINPYLFYDIIIASVILVATLTITDTLVDQLLKCLPVA